MRKLLNDECGFVITAELVLVLTIAVLAMVVGLSAVRDAISQEMNDLSSAFGAIDQTNYTVGLHKAKSGGAKHHALIAGWGYIDRGDDCDCTPITYREVCGKPDSSLGADNEGNL